MQKFQSFTQYYEHNKQAYLERQIAIILTAEQIQSNSTFTFQFLLSTNYYFGKIQIAFHGKKLK